MKSSINIGIVGAGNRAGGLGHYLRTLKGVRITGLCDPDMERLNNLADDLEVPENGRFAGFKEMMKSSLFDSVVITSPDHTHYEIVMAAAKNKKHIFCEKPMALKLEHCIEMQKAAEKNNLIFMMGFCLRYNNLYGRAREIIASGEIGRIRLVHAVDSVERGSAYFFHSWQRLRRNSGGLLLQKATHSLDIINWMIDSNPVSVYALGGLDVFGGKESNGKRCADCKKKKSCPEFIDAGRYHGDYLSGKAFVIEDKCVFAEEIDIMDNESLLIKYGNGAKASFVECQFTPDYKREFSFVGDLGRLDILDFYTHNGISWTPFHELTISKRHSAETVRHHVHLREGGHGGGDPAMMDEFIEVLSGKKKRPLAGGMAGVISTALAAAGEKSILTGKVEPVYAGKEQFCKKPLTESGI
jgi:predicted dehydrogenase